MREVLKDVVVAGLGAALALGVSANASADLIFAGNVELFGQGFGANGINIVTGHDVGSSPHPEIESAIIDAATGLLGRQGGTGEGTVQGGDEPPPNPPDPKHNTPTLSELGALSAGLVGLIFNIAETGPTHELTLGDEKLYLEFFNPTTQTSFVAFFDGGPITLAGEPGVGNAGFVFLLDPTQAAEANAFRLGVDCVIGAGFEVTGFDGGPETLTAVVIPQPVVIPEPATMALLGTGLAGLGLWRRKWLFRRKD